MYGGVPHYAWDHGRPQNFKRRLKVVGPAFLAIDKPELAKSLEKGDKCVLHAGLLSELHHKMEELAISGRPMIFEATHEETKRKTHCGVLEFSGEEYNVVYMPQWMMHNLGIEDGAFIMFRMIQLPTVKYLRLRPSDDSFVHSVPEPKLALEEALHSFTAVTVGDELVIHHHDTPYHFTVLAVKPETGNKAACLVGAECELEFAGLDEPMEGAHAGAGASAGSSGSVSAPYATAQQTGGLGLGLGLGAGGAGGSGEGTGVGRKGSVHFPENSPMLGGASGPGGGGSGRASPAAPSAPRKIEIGETLAGELRDGQSSHCFTVIVRAPYVQVPHAIRFLLSSTSSKGFTSPPTAAGAAGGNAAAAGRSTASTVTSTRVSAFDSGGMVPGLGLEPPSSTGSAGAGAEGAAAPGSAGKPPRAGAGHSRAESAASAFAGGSGRVGGSSPLVSASTSGVALAAVSLEADLFVTGQSSLTTKPSKRLFTWAEVSAAASKSLCLLPSAGSSTLPPLPAGVRGPSEGENGSAETLPPANDTTGSIVLYAAVEASELEPLSVLGASVSYTLTVEAIPLVTLAQAAAGGAAVGSSVILPPPLPSVSAGSGTGASGSASAAAGGLGGFAPTMVSASATASTEVAPTSAATQAPGTAPGPAAAPAGTKQCDNCGQFVPEHTHTMHSAYCKRNISKCGVCGVSVQARQADKHVHCPGAPETGTGTQVGGWPECKAVLGSAWEAQKHASIFHSSFPCEACAQAVSRSTYPSHRANDCPLRIVPCVYCGMSLQFKTRAEHEDKCGGRTLPCDLCSRLVPRKRMAMHKESGCQLGGTGATPQTPFVRPTPSRGLELPPELAGMAADIDMDAQFALDGMPGASALGFSPSTARSLGMGRPASAAVPAPAARSAPPARLPAVDFNAGDVEYEYHYDDEDEDGDEEMDTGEDEGHGGRGAGTAAADRVPPDSDIVIVDDDGTGAPSGARQRMAGMRRPAGASDESGARMGQRVPKKVRTGHGSARMYDSDSSSEGEYEAAWAAAGRAAAARASDFGLGGGRGGSGSHRERCTIQGCNALAEEGGWEGLHLHWLTTCAANQPGATDAQKAELAQLLEVAAHSQQDGQGDAQGAPPSTAAATPSTGTSASAAPASTLRGSRLRICPACGLVFQPGEQEDEVQVHILSACAVAASGQDGLDSTDWIAQIGSFAPPGSVPGSHVAGYSPGPSGASATVPAPSAPSVPGGVEQQQDELPPLAALGSLGLPSANLSHRASNASSRPSLGLGLGLGVEGVGVAVGGGRSPHEDDEESRMLAEALAASLHGSSLTAPSAAGGATSSAHTDILPRRSRPSSFHVLDTDHEGDEEAAEAEALGGAATHGQGQAIQPTAPPADAEAGATAPAPGPAAAIAPAGAADPFQCYSCPYTAGTEEALQLHMLTECEHKEQNERILFG